MPVVTVLVLRQDSEQPAAPAAEGEAPAAEGEAPAGDAS